MAISGVPSASSRTSSASVRRSGPNSREPRRDELGVADGQAADDGTRRDLERLLEARACPNAAAELHVDAGRLAHAPDQRQVDGLAAFRAVEIDDVQPARAELAVLHGELDGVDGVARLLREVAVQEPHAAPVAQVDGRYQLHE